MWLRYRQQPDYLIKVGWFLSCQRRSCVSLCPVFSTSFSTVFTYSSFQLLDLVCPEHDGLCVPAQRWIYLSGFSELELHFSILICVWSSLRCNPVTSAWHLHGISSYILQRLRVLHVKLEITNVSVLKKDVVQHHLFRFDYPVRQCGSNSLMLVWRCVAIHSPQQYWLLLLSV